MNGHSLGKGIEVSWFGDKQIKDSSRGSGDPYARLMAAVIVGAVEDYLSGDYCKAFESFVFLNTDGNAYLEVLQLESVGASVSVLFDKPGRAERKLKYKHFIGGKNYV